MRLIKEQPSDEVEFEEWNGKLEYLIRNCKLHTDGKAQTSIEIIKLWLRQKINKVDYNESRFEIDLHPGTVSEIPSEEPFNVSAI